MVQLLELVELGVVKAFLNVERKRYLFEIVPTDGLVVHLHVVEDGLLVREVVVVLHLGVVEGAVVRHVLLLLLFLVVLLALQLFGCGGSRTTLVLFIVFQVVGQRTRSQLVLFGRVNQVLLGRVAILISGLSRQLGLGSTARFDVLSVLFFRLRFLNLLERLDAIQNPVGLPLGPDEVIVVPVIVLAQRPPESGLEGSPHDV